MELVFYAARLVLAHNRSCSPATNPFLRRSSAARSFRLDSSRRRGGCSRNEPRGAIDYYEEVAGYFSEYDYPDQERISFILENEWSWFSRMPSLGDW